MNREQTIAAAGLLCFMLLVLSVRKLRTIKCASGTTRIQQLPVLAPSAARKTYLQRLVRPSTPPGPKQDWLIGNLRHLPRERFYERFSEWQRDYGDIIYATALGRSLLVVNSYDIARELAVKRSSIYSGRPGFIMVGELMGWDWILTGMDPGSRHTESRKIIHKSLGPSTVSTYDFVLTSELDNLVKKINLEKDQLDLFEEVIHAISAMVIRITYGDEVVNETGEELIKTHHEAFSGVNWITSQFWPVEYLPILRYLPSWIPGVKFKTIAKQGRASQEAVRHMGFKRAMPYFESGKLGTCMVEEHMSRALEKNEVDLLRDSLGVMFGAAVDTTSYTTLIFIAALVSHPEIQKKIQDEMDAFLYETSKSILSPPDLAHLPYLQAAWKESIRWQPTLPLGVPHLALREDVYQNWYIPKDTIVVLNAGFMCRDPRIWDEPERFRPERWLKEYNPNVSQLPDIYDIAFGFGRRVCPGKCLGDRMGLYVSASLLSLFDILPPDGQPTPTPESWEYADNFARYPANLKCRFRERTRQDPDTLV